VDSGGSAAMPPSLPGLAGNAYPVVAALMISKKINLYVILITYART